MWGTCSNYFSWGAGSFWLLLCSLLFIALFVGLIIALVRTPSHHDQALQLLDEKYAKGEITYQQYLQRYHNLKY